MAEADRTSKARRGESAQRRRLHRLLLGVGVVFAMAGAGLLISSSFVDGVKRDILLAFGAGLLTASVVEIVFEFFLEGLLDLLVERSAEEIRTEIAGQTKDLASASKSLEAISESGIFQVYKDRDSAAPDMKRDLIDDNVSSVRLIGISLNDFVSRTNPKLGEAWRTLTGYVTGKPMVSGRRLDIKVLVADPDSLGGQLRALAENRDEEIPTKALRLKDDVERTERELDHLKQQAAKCNDVTFDYRLYTVPPMLFLCRTDSATYIQQYYFWSSREDIPPIPVLGFRALSEPQAALGMHDDVLDHFEWIWDHASVPGPIGVRKTRTSDRALHQLGMRSVFIDSAEALNYIAERLRQAKSKVYIQGISLKSFVDPFGSLFEYVSDLPGRDVDVKVLLTDPDCEQALYRSFREHLFDHPAANLDDYLSGGEHKQSTLYGDTAYTIGKLCYWLDREPRADRVEVKKYASAPACFMLVIDDTVLVEQYVYGKVDSGGGLTRKLGTDMPLVEYTREPSALYPGADPLRNPYELLVNHFEFVFDRCAKPIDC